MRCEKRKARSELYQETRIHPTEGEMVVFARASRLKESIQREENTR